MFVITCNIRMTLVKILYGKEHFHQTLECREISEERASNPPTFLHCAGPARPGSRGAPGHRGHQVRGHQGHAAVSSAGCFHLCGHVYCLLCQVLYISFLVICICKKGIRYVRCSISRVLDPL